MPKRCPWVPDGNTLYERYHDLEWGVPVLNDHKLFEFLVLESAQAGLSWATILNKRENYRKAFANFDFAKVAKFNASDIARLMNDAGIVRNRAKIEAAINNAQRFLEIRTEHGSFARYMWGFVGFRPVQSKLQSMNDYKPTSTESEALAKDMKEKGFRFFGPTTCYAHMQAVGMANDHTIDCFRYKETAGMAHGIEKSLK
ncbi:MAG: DNA-3-methyladenine glycosylase I [Candidatus Aenigmarchaeota archaeon]|nr:DNA-3-methyladenine glycosylase I [Candidatus Aenigmarchaeota archaeon]